MENVKKYARMMINAINLYDILGLMGAALIVSGVRMWSIPAALILSGVILIGVALAGARRG